MFDQDEEYSKWEGTNIPRKAYATYVMGKNAALSLNVPSKLDTTGMKMKNKKLTKKRELQNAYEAINEKDNHIISLNKQMREQNELLNRVRIEGNALIDKYNKLAGKFNAIRSLVTTND